MSRPRAPEGVDTLIAVGSHAVRGARPLNRAGQRWIENPLAQMILAGSFMPGTTVTGKVADDEIAFVRQRSSTLDRRALEPRAVFLRRGQQ
ncbi:hypothetical protein EWW49_28230 [Pseudomonas syringae]|nr:hypothetical protein EWW49_28230 [Pseudomonas syringae]